MANELILPLMGEGVVEAQIGRWLKQVGDKIEEGDPIVEVETDKVTTELDAEFEGTLLKIVVQEGETAAVNQVLAVIGEPGEETNGASQTTSPAKQASIDSMPTQLPQSVVAKAVSEETTAVSSGDYTGRISPVVKRMVKEHNLDLSMIEGTGKNGRITKRDVEAYLEGLPTGVPTAPPAKPTPQPVNGAASTTVQPAQPPRLAPIPANSDLVPFNNMRRKIAEHMVMSKRESPHATTVFEIDFSRVTADRKGKKHEFEKRGVNLTYLAYIAAAVVKALQEVPVANSQWHDKGIVLHREVHLGMATAVDNGLVVPVIKNADTLNLFGLAKTIEELAEKARGNKLQSQDLQGGTFTITNHGVFGSLFATPIINQPQSGILGIGTIEKRVCVVDDMITIRPKSYFSFSFDHRILDGADADRFMQVIKESIENW